MFVLSAVVVSKKCWSLCHRATFCCFAGCAGGEPFAPFATLRGCAGFSTGVPLLDLFDGAGVCAACPPPEESVASGAVAGNTFWGVVFKLSLFRALSSFFSASRSSCECHTQHNINNKQKIAIGNAVECLQTECSQSIPCDFQHFPMLRYASDLPKTMCKSTLVLSHVASYNVCLICDVCVCMHLLRKNPKTLPNPRKKR